jgi:hypothetical protein
MSYSLQQIAPRHVAYGDVMFGVPGISAESIIDLNGRIDHLDGDIRASAPVQAANPDGTLNQKWFEWMGFLAQWIGFRGEWSAWYTSHQKGWTLVPASAEIEFGNFKSKYNLFLTQFIAFGGVTTAGPVSTNEPPPGTTKTWLEQLGNVVTPLAWIVGIGAAIYFIGPFIPHPTRRAT